ncbi:DUF3108 domain-containing protein [Methylobacterium sp. Leaf93]|uniref:DUF3108 domain-containing protein n=1 Tax=Methylobacterium sp. Leaf93 TaxID=1736249 RepID=UPI0006F46EE9|nr:DUF3108 domain-containing protein [Methylobacterium sp. Leaf93]KQP16882.1 hypothetical protein ASF26_03510 [Methylobacterium sp. Leaf93]
MVASSNDARETRSIAMIGAALLALAAPAPASAAPEPQRFSITYRLSFLDLPVGEATLAVDQAGGRYAYDLKAGLRGLVGVFFEGSGTASASGERSRTGALTGTFRSESLYGRKPVQVSMVLSGGRAHDESVEPPPTPTPDRIPVAPQDKVGVVDPLTMLAIPLGAAPLDVALCERRIPVFNGVARADIVLSRGVLVTVQEGPYRGPALDCRARWVPISGHRPNGSSVRRMAENDDIRVRLAPVPGGAMMLPLTISLATGWGRAGIEATQWGAPLKADGRGAVKVHLPNAR